MFRLRNKKIYFLLGLAKVLLVSSLLHLKGKVFLPGRFRWRWGSAFDFVFPLFVCGQKILSFMYLALFFSSVLAT